MLTTGGITVRPPPELELLGRVAVIVTGVLMATGEVMALKVPLVAEPITLKLPGTVTTPVLLLFKLMVNPDGGAGPLRVTVPTEPFPPVTELGLNVKEAMTAGFTVKVPIWLLGPTVAVTATGVVIATPTVVAVKV